MLSGSSNFNGAASSILIFKPWDEGIDRGALSEIISVPDDISWGDVLTDTAKILGYSSLDDGQCYGFASAGSTAFWVSVLGYSDAGIKRYLERFHFIKN
jgi:hypothetical protein